MESHSFGRARSESEGCGDHFPPRCSNESDVLRHFTDVLDDLTDPAKHQWNKTPTPRLSTGEERRRYVEAVLDNNPPISPVPVACLTCKSCWFCTCTHVGFACDRKRSRSPPMPPPPQMVEVLKNRRGSKWEQWEQQASSSSTQEQQRQTAKRQGPGPLTPFLHGQTDWTSIKERLPEKTLRLERTEQMFKELLDDREYHIRVNLAPNTYYIQHCSSVVGALPTTSRFKFGITVNPHHRWYEAHYAYSKSRFQLRDGVQYNEMVVVYAHHSRDVVAMAEHCLIDKFHTNSRCANRKIDYDNHIRNDDSESDDTRSEGPHVLYICHGKAIQTRLC